MDPKNPITLLIPLIGIALILLAVWLTGGTRRARLDRTLVLRRLAEDLPGFAAAEIVIDADGANALAAGAEGRGFAIVFAAGDKVVVRSLAQRDWRRITCRARAWSSRPAISPMAASCSPCRATPSVGWRGWRHDPRAEAAEPGRVRHSRLHPAGAAGDRGDAGKAPAGL